MSSDTFLLDCHTYEDYLDTFITKYDLRFVREIQPCRMFVKLGYRSPTELYSPIEYMKRKKIVEESLWPTKKPNILFSPNLNSNDPVLKELAVREKPNYQKLISTIIFLKHRSKAGFEISGFIDYEHSLRKANLYTVGVTNWAGVFNGTVTLIPKRTHLSYFDWHQCQVSYNDSDNYQVLHDIDNGLTFMHKGDHKKICVHSDKEIFKRDFTRTMHYSPKYGYVILFDHPIRKKN